MGSSYTIFGKQVPSHVVRCRRHLALWPGTNIQLAILTLGSAAGVVMYPRGKANATPTPAPVAQTSSEDDFDLEKLIKYVIDTPNARAIY